jgi:hypothetical protein
MKSFTTLSCALVCAVASILTLPCHSQTPYDVNYTIFPWEAAVSGDFTRVNIPAMAQAVAVLNTQPSSAPYTPLTTGDFHLAGGTIDLQRNFQSHLSLQFSVSGGYADRTLFVPAPDTILYPSLAAKPMLFTALFGPVFATHRWRQVDLLARVLVGGARGDVAPGPALDSAVYSLAPSFKFTDTGAAADIGVGVSVPFTQHLAIKLGGDDISTWLYGGRKDQLRGSAGVVWKFGRRSEIFDPTPYQ